MKKLLLLLCLAAAGTACKAPASVTEAPEFESTEEVRPPGGFDKPATIIPSDQQER